MTLVTLAEIRAARELLDGVIRKTPVEPCRTLDAVLASRRPFAGTAAGAGAGAAWLKCENLQRAGSFKIRGAYLRIARLGDRQRARGVVAASAGNHAQGVALAASLLGTCATVFMPVGAALPKVAATRGYGARVELTGSSVDEAIEAAQEHARATGAVFIHPFDHPDVIAGQGTIALEIVEQVPQVRTLVVGIGGGGLVSGIAVAAKALLPGVRVVGVQAVGAAAFPPSLAAGGPRRLARCATIADGIAVGRPGDLTFAHVSKLVDQVVTVSDEDISRALLMLLERCKMVVEPAGAVAVAALVSGAVEVEPPVVAVISGGNIDPILLLRVIEHGLTAAGRYLSLTVRCADQPGQLARLLGVIANAGANVIGVDHRRHDRRLRLGEVEVDLSVETRGPEHSEALAAVLRATGYSLSHPVGG